LVRLKGKEVKVWVLATALYNHGSGRWWAWADWVDYNMLIYMQWV